MNVGKKGDQSDEIGQLRSEQILDDDIEGWLSCDDGRPTSNAPNTQDEDYAVRLLICQTSNAADGKICYHMSKDSYLAAEKCLGLAQRTLTSANDLWSVQACQFLPTIGKDGKEAISLGKIYHASRTTI